MIPSIAPRARDITFRFENSCNSWCCRLCCSHTKSCFHEEYNDEQPIYINSKGNVEMIDIEKYTNPLEQEKSMERLQFFIREKVHTIADKIEEPKADEQLYVYGRLFKDKRELICYHLEVLKTTTGIDFQAKQEVVTYDHMKQVNKIIETFHREVHNKMSGTITEV